MSCFFVPAPLHYPSHHYTELDYKKATSHHYTELDYKKATSHHYTELDYKKATSHHYNCQKVLCGTKQIKNQTRGTVQTLPNLFLSLCVCVCKCVCIRGGGGIVV